MASKSGPVASAREFQRPLRGLAAIAVAGILAACGSTGTGGSTGGGAAGGQAGAPAHPAAAKHGAVLSSRKLPGIGVVLVDRAGKTVYSPAQEATGRISCTGGCLGFWFPVTVARAATPAAPAGVPGKLGTIHRPDDSLTQLTYDGKPLYTFRLDQSPGQAQGNDFTDQFAGTSFTWHALSLSGSPARQGGSGGSPGGYGGSSGY